MSKLHVVIKTERGAEHGQVIGQSTDEQKMNDLARSEMGGRFSKSGNTYKNNRLEIDVVDKDDLRNTY